VLFAAAGYVPILGIFVSLVAPTPLLLVALRHNMKIGGLALGYASLILFILLTGIQSHGLSPAGMPEDDSWTVWQLAAFQTLIFIAEYGVMALTLAEGIRRQWSVEKTLGAATLAPLFVTALVIAAILLSVDVDLSTFRKQVEDNLSQALQPYMMEGDNAIEGDVRMYVQGAMSHVIGLLPALFVMSTAASVILSYGIVRLVWRRVKGASLFPDLAFAQWTAPEPCIWVLIASGMASFLPFPPLQSVALNVLVLVGLVYLIQGWAILIFYLNKAPVPPIVRGIAYLFLMIQPVLLLGVAAFGVFDLWFDFRRIRNKREASQ
jgi:uncharacterized protein YybS (DUF2232 family)